jgi:hypothetical protein
MCAQADATPTYTIGLSSAASVVDTLSHGEVGSSTTSLPKPGRFQSGSEQNPTGDSHCGIGSRAVRRPRSRHRDPRECERREATRIDRADVAGGGRRRRRQRGEVVRAMQ